MKETIKDFVAIVASVVDCGEPVHEFGALQVAGQEGFADLRPLFPGADYVGSDMREGPGVDMILDLHDLDLAEGSVGTALCLETLEHVEYPHRALEEIYRVLKPDGMVVISSQMAFPIHNFPYDYWRFTPEAFRSLLKPFATVFVGYAGAANFPHTVVGIGFKGHSTALDGQEFTKKYREWQASQQRVTLQQVLKQVTPPFLWTMATRSYRAVFPLKNQPT